MPVANGISSGHNSQTKKMFATAILKWREKNGALPYCCQHYRYAKCFCPPVQTRWDTFDCQQLSRSRMSTVNWENITYRGHFWCLPYLFWKAKIFGNAWYFFKIISSGHPGFSFRCCCCCCWILCGCCYFCCCFCHMRIKNSDGVSLRHVDIDLSLAKSTKKMTIACVGFLRLTAGAVPYQVLSKSKEWLLCAGKCKWRSWGQKRRRRRHLCFWLSHKDKGGKRQKQYFLAQKTAIKVNTKLGPRVLCICFQCHFLVLCTRERLLFCCGLSPTPKSRGILPCFSSCLSRDLSCFLLLILSCCSQYPISTFLSMSKGKVLSLFSAKIAKYGLCSKDSTGMSFFNFFLVSKYLVETAADFDFFTIFLQLYIIFRRDRVKFRLEIK